MTPDTIARLRADTRACAGLLHFNNAGAALMPDPVFRAVQGYLADERDMGGYEAEAAREPDLDAFYTGAAALIGADASEIAFAESATRAWDMTAYGLRWQPGDEVIVHRSDYGSYTLSLRQMVQRFGIVVRECPSDTTGQIDTQVLAAMIGARTRAISLSHVPTQSGLVNPAEEVGQIARAAGVVYLLDACQSLGQVEVDVRAIGCDVLSGTGRKFLRGPRGTGILYVAKGMLDRIDPPFIDGHSASPSGDGWIWREGARRFEAFEQNFAGKAGLATAIAYARATGMPAIAARIATLAARLREALVEVPGVTVMDEGVRKCGIVTFLREGRDSATLSAALRGQGINTSVSTPHWAPMDFAARGMRPMVRASVHAYNTEGEVERFAGAIAAL